MLEKMKRLTTEEFIRRAKEVHGDKYDYSLVDYNGEKVKVKIVCKIHGVFEITPYNHIHGYGCPFCSGCAELTTENFQKKVRFLYGEKFDVSDVIIDKNSKKEKVSVICNTCGKTFEVNPYVFTSTRQGGKCPHCRNEQFRVEREETFLNNSKEKFGDKYIYPNLHYINNSTNIDVICPDHGLFSITPQHHLNSPTGCPQCSVDAQREKFVLSNEEFKKRAHEVHGDRYLYDKTDYKGMFVPVIITCRKHSDYTQLPVNHLKGQGCPFCRGSIGEEKVALFLVKHNIKYIKEYYIKNEYLFSNRKKIFADFYLPDYNMIIEFNGAQHYQAFEAFGGEKQFQEQQKRDMALRYYCKEHKITLIEIHYKDIGNIEKLLSKELKIKNNSLKIL